MCKERKEKLGKVGKGSVAELHTKPHRNCNFKNLKRAYVGWEWSDSS